MRWIVLLALVALAGPAWSGEMPDCRAAAGEVGTAFPLPHTAGVLATKRLNVLVVGAGSSALPGPEGRRKAYPARLQAALAAALPGTAITVATDVEPHRTAEDMVRVLKPALANTKAELVIWQTGTIDAMQGVEPDRFGDALEQGIEMTRAAGADMLLIDAQYSPRTDSMIALGAYIDQMRQIAAQHEVPLFDRFSVMKTWADLGVFDLYAATKKLDTAERVHDCLGRLLAGFVLESAKLGGPPPEQTGSAR
jgi:hypothetical protein